MKPIYTFALVLGFAAVATADDNKWSAPSPLSATQMTDVKRVMSTIEDRADKFESEFLKGLRASTVKIEDREKYRVWVDQLEDRLDNMAEEYHEGDIAEAQKELKDAMEAARNINNFMLNAKWSSEAESLWRGIRDDLNSLAKHHRAPTAVLIIANL